QRHPRQDGDAMMHFLAIELVMDIAARMEQVGRENMVLRLGLLQAEDVRLFLVEQPLDDMRTGADRVYIPRSDLERGHGLSCSALSSGVKEDLSVCVPRTHTERPLLR